MKVQLTKEEVKEIREASENLVASIPRNWEAHSNLEFIDTPKLTQ